MTRSSAHPAGAPRNLRAPISIAALVVVSFALNIIPDHRGDGTYYAASRLLLEGRFGPQVYDDAWMRKEIEAATQGRVSDIFTPNPPTAVLIALPVAWLSPDIARRVWAALNGALLLTVVTALAPLPPPSAGGMEFTLWTGAVSFALLSTPIYEVFRLGQAYILLLALFVTAWFGVRRHWPPLAGLSLALALCLKLSGAPFWILLAARREWRALAWAAGFALLILTVTLPIVGVETWQVFLTRVLPGAATSPTIAVTAYQSLPGFWAHVFRYDAQWNPAPLADWPALAAALTALTALGVIGVTIHLTRHSSSAAAFAAMVMASVFLVPYAEQHHYALAVFPLWIAISNYASQSLISPLAIAPQRHSNTATTLLVIAALLIALPLPYKSAALSTGWWALFAYPRLYGGLILWGVLLHLAHEASRS